MSGYYLLLCRLYPQWLSRLAKEKVCSAILVRML